MTHHPFESNPASGGRSQRGAAMPWVFFGFLLVAGFFFFTEHRAHLMGALPFVLLALCPLMHLFHGGHGGHGRDSGARGHQGHGSLGDADGDRAPPPKASDIARPPHRH